MNVVVKGKSLDITPALRDVIVSRLQRLEKYFVKEVNINVTASVENKTHVLEMTLLVDGKVLRAEDSSDDMYKTLEIVADKLEKQIKKYRSSRKKGRSDESIRFAGPGEEEEPQDEFRPKIVKTKDFVCQTMTEEEAMLQMELLGHPFYAYISEETSMFCIMYKRKDGNVGILIPEGY